MRMRGHVRLRGGKPDLAADIVDVDLGSIAGHAQFPADSIYIERLAADAGDSGVRADDADLEDCRAWYVDDQIAVVIRTVVAEQAPAESLDMQHQMMFVTGNIQLRAGPETAAEFDLRLIPSIDLDTAAHIFDFDATVAGYDPGLIQGLG